MHVPDRQALADATDLMAMYGEHACYEAAARAESSRNVGNVVHYCRWRQIERTIAMLSTEDVVGTIH